MDDTGMNEIDGQLDHNRLFEAAEAVLDAIVELARERDGMCPYPTAVMGTDEQPDCLARFTRGEVREATDFLMRAGFVEAENIDR